MLIDKNSLWSSSSETLPFRSTSISKILRNLQESLDSRQGSVTYLKKIEIHPALNVYLSGANPAAAGLGSTRETRGIRNYCSGKGITNEVARISALSEVVERLSGTFLGTEEFISGSYNNLQSCIHPNDLQQFSPLQFENRLILNDYYKGFCEIPLRFDPSAQVMWSPARSLSTDRICYVPTAWAYYAVPQEGELDFFRSSSNGCAAGSTRNEAILHGLLELIERDAIACWWYSRARRPEVYLDSTWREASQIVGALSELGRKVWLLDVTSDFGIPVVVAVSRRTTPGPEEIVMGFGAHFNLKLAAERSLCEVVQLLPEATLMPAQADGFHHFNPSITYWWRNAQVEKMPFLLPDSRKKIYQPTNLPDPSNASIEDALFYLDNTIEKAGLEAFVIDQTRSDMPLAVVKTIVPGLRRIQPTFAPGRLFQTPVQLGWLPNEIQEHELNPMPLPA